MTDHPHYPGLKPYLILGVVCFLLLNASSGSALEPEPRKWNHLPVGVDFAGVAYVYTEADILFDPTLLLDDVEMEMQNWVGKYIKTFELFDKSARIDIIQGFQDVEWTGLVNNTAAKTSRRGLTDTIVRFGVNLYGAPPLKGKEFISYRSTKQVETIVGVGLSVRLPTGNYKENKLLNIGKNRFTFRPQVGFIHTRGKWTFETTGEVAFFTKNNDFFDGNDLEQNPLYIIHSHLIYTLQPGLWAGAGFGYDYGGESKVNGERKDDRKQNIGWICSLNYPVNRAIGLKIAYIGTRTQENTGLDSDSIITSIAFAW
jgi:hypothetical protein